MTAGWMGGTPILLILVSMYLYIIKCNHELMVFNFINIKCIIDTPYLSNINNMQNSPTLVEGVIQTCLDCIRLKLNTRKRIQPTYPRCQMRNHHHHLSETGFRVSEAWPVWICLTYNSQKPLTRGLPHSGSHAPPPPVFGKTDDPCETVSHYRWKGNLPEERSRSSKSRVIK